MVIPFNRIAICISHLKKKIEAIIHNMVSNNCALLEVSDYKFLIDSISNQKDAIIKPDKMIEKVTKGLVGDFAEFPMGIGYQDTRLIITWRAFTGELVFDLPGTWEEAWHPDDSDFQHAWRKEFVRGEYKDDIARYMRLILNLVDPIIIDQVKSFSEQLTDLDVPEYFLGAKIDMSYEFISIEHDIVNNILWNKFFVALNPSVKELPKTDVLIDYIRATDPAELYIFDKKQPIAKLEVYREKQQLLLRPLQPYRMKSFLAEQGIDLQFYARLLIGLCGEFPILKIDTSYNI